ncbi:MAG: hypothetical protein OEU44_04485 [Gammaproteobacteria bacterium]|nr:hypothetical protein [Gammaproteobacteria bacterium]
MNTHPATRFPRNGLLAIIAAVVCTILLGACSSSLPRVEKKVGSIWGSFEEAKTAYDLIIPGQTTREELQRIGFNPYTSPNISILNYLNIANRFMPNDSITLDDLDPAVRSCIQARQACQAYAAKPSLIISQRTGNVVSDTLNFHRNVIETGWTFDALILLQDDSVVYKLWGGTPMLDEVTDHKNPLGPLQDTGGMARDAIKP